MRSVDVARRCLRGPREMAVEAARAVDFVKRGTESCLQLDYQRDVSQILQMFDDISDRICQVIDTAEFVRTMHAEAAPRNAATRASQEMNCCIQELNTSKPLYELLRSIRSSSTVWNEMNKEQQRMTENLMEDFEDNGIVLSKDVLENVRNAHHHIASSAIEFSTNVVNGGGHVELKDTPIESLPISVRPYVEILSDEAETIMSRRTSLQRGRCPRIRVPTLAPFRDSVLNRSPSSADRKIMYEAAFTVPNNLSALQQLLERRQSLASLTGHSSYAHLKMKSASVKCPDAAEQFLHDVTTSLRPALDNEVGLLCAEKKICEGNDRIGLWDEWYYKPRVVARKSTGNNLRDAREYFPISSVLNGLCVLFDQVFAVRMEEIDVEPTESWCRDDYGEEAPGLRKFAFFCSKSSRPLGHVFVDLFSRAGKPMGASHYVLRGGRRLDESARQLPIVVVSCSFTRPPRHSTPLCSVGAAETLVHEFGHAIHSLSSATDYQHLSGTRVPTDIVEIPALLLSKFLWDPRSMALFTKHVETGRPLPSSEIVDLIARERTFAALEQTHTAVQGMMDLRLHRANERFDAATTTELLYELQDRYLIGIERSDRVQWHSQFTHLVNYGASYYTYLVGKAYADAFWEMHFAKNPLEKWCGVAFREDFLEAGNAKRPEELLLGGDFSLEKAAARFS